MSELSEEIKKNVEKVFESLITIRRHLHKHPELSFKEYKTAEYIESKLAELSIPSERIAETGVLAKITGSGSGEKSLILRGDIDALPILENTGLDFTSENKGVMHACGHDVHTTCVMGAAMILNEKKDSFGGVVYILFQPGEEKLPGGASIVLADGKIQEIKPSCFIGQHVYPELEAGQVGFRSGMYMASADELYVTLNGPGGHAALPDRTVDIINVASRLIQKSQDQVKGAEIPSVLTFGSIHASGATNVIPKEVKIEGTFRTMNEEWRSEVHNRLKSVSKDLEEETGAKIDMDIHVGYPCLINDEEVTKKVRSVAEDLLGKENVIDLDRRMTSEDFAFFTQEFPSCFYRLGVRSKGGEIFNLHTPEFRIDEDAIKTGVAMMTLSALEIIAD